MTVAVRQALFSIRKHKNGSRRKWGAYTWRGRHYNSSKHCQLLVQRHDVTYHKTWTYRLERFWGKNKWEGYEYSATSRHNTITSAWMVSLYIAYQMATQYQQPQHHHLRLDGVTIYSISNGNSIQCNQQTLHHHLRSVGVTIHTAYKLITQYRATSRHKTTTSIRLVSLHTQHINTQLSTHVLYV
jgi:hypothetical protein